MADQIRNRIWLGRAAFAATAGLLVFGALLPLDTLPRAWVGPDILLAVTLVWIGRRPDHVPLGIVAALFFLADLLLQRPPGLMAALVVILTEVLRTRAEGLRGMPFLAEWATVAVGVVAVAIANRFAMAMAIVPQAPAGPVVLQTVMTILCYPVLVGLAYTLFGISRPAPGETDAMGRKL
jgi:rod shape-determining protein MreD